MTDLEKEPELEEEPTAEDGEESVAPKKRKSRRSYTREEWIKIKTLWEGGHHTIREIADMFERDYSTLHVKLSKAGSVRGSRREESDKLATRELERDMAKNVGLRVKRANETKSEHYEWARKLSQLNVQTIAKCIEEKRALGSAKADLLTLKTAMEILEKGQSQRNIALGLDKGDIVDEETLPEFGVYEMTADQQDEVARKADELLTVSNDLVILDDVPESEIDQQDTDTELKHNMERLRTKIAERDAEKEARIPGNDADL